AWIQAAKKSISSHKRFNSKIFLFLIPYTSLFLNDKKEWEELKEILQKRKLKLRFPSEPDWRKVAEICLDLSPLFAGRKKPIKDPGTEEYIAWSEMEFCKNKNSNGLKILVKGYDQLLFSKPASFSAYIDFVITKAREYNDSDLELKFIEHHITNEPSVSPVYLSRISELLKKKAESEYIDHLVKNLEKTRQPFDKIATLLLHQKRYDDLILRINREENKFRLLNTVLLGKLPQVDEPDFRVYVRHFKQAIAQALETHYQEFIFNQARQYIDKLPAGLKSKLLNLLLAETPKSSYLRSYILKCYSVPG
ncbi:MAG: hypothetical protein K0S12_1859, partial [Bacteroidetes bacterium]|nr:hypothetical protein [Bacteroidota bacterium]